MDNYSDSDSAYRFGPDRRLTAVTGAIGLVAVAIAVLTTDSGTRFLLSLSALLLFGYAVTDLLFWPRLTITRLGVQVHGPFERAALGWHEVQDIRADVRVRHGLRSTALEVDTGTSLIVLSRRALGADPAVVADLAATLRS